MNDTETVTFNKYATEDLARQLLDREGLHDWTFTWSNAKRQFGLCQSSRKTIKLSEPLSRLNPQHIEDTILHEIAHALAGHEAGHGPKWRRYCRDLGANPSRVVEEAEAAPYKWMGTCNDCGKQFARYRLTKKARAGLCPDCYRRPGTNLIEIFSLENITPPGKITWRQLR